MTSGIYIIKNLVNEKLYVGSSVNMEERIAHHKSKLKMKSHDNEHLQRAYNKYGKDNFLFYSIENCSLEDLEIREDYYIDLYNTISPDYGYNKKWGFGRKKNSTDRIPKPMLDSTKAKLSLALKGRPKTESWKKKVSVPKTESWKKKIGLSHLNKKLNIPRTSKYLGVYSNGKGKWISNIRSDGIRKYLGIFENEIYAAIAFDIEYCRINNTPIGINFPNGI